MVGTAEMAEGHVGHLHVAHSPSPVSSGAAAAIVEPVSEVPSLFLGKGWRLLLF